MVGGRDKERSSANSRRQLLGKRISVKRECEGGMVGGKRAKKEREVQMVGGNG